jgi:hypothetical protein
MARRGESVQKTKGRINQTCSNSCSAYSWLPWGTHSSPTLQTFLGSSFASNNPTYRSIASCTLTSDATAMKASVGHFVSAGWGDLSVVGNY